MIKNNEIQKLEKEKLKYALGALMYCPANNKKVAENILNKKFKNLSTIVLCLEDAILPQFLDEATNILEETLIQIQTEKRKNHINDLPLIFIRVRNPKHLEEVFKRFYSFYDIITGFVLPKYDMTVANEYLRIVRNINNYHKFYYLPILESSILMDCNCRRQVLNDIKNSLAKENSILGILVGSNDMCSYFGFRRNAQQTVYDIGVVRDVLVDIISIFGKDYVVNGPVWEFFDGPHWKSGLQREIELDKINGFIGKACIHPKQVEVVNECMKISYEEYEDALELVNWDIPEGVKKSPHSGRMNEIATNQSWAERIKILGDIYGVHPYKED